MNFRQGRTIRRGSGSFTGNWVSGAAETRSLRRRLMAALRSAHRVLGMRRKNMGLGTLGVGGVVATLGAFAIAVAATSTASATPVQLGGGTVGGAGEQVAIGANSKAIVSGGGGGSPIAIGVGSNASGASGTPLPGGFTSFEAIAIGNSATATGQGSTSLGTAGDGSPACGCRIIVAGRGTGAEGSGVPTRSNREGAQGVGASPEGLGLNTERD